MTTVTHIKREAGVHAGIPVVATASQFTAPIHIDVGGNSYTSSAHHQASELQIVQDVQRSDQINLWVSQVTTHCVQGAPLTP